MNGPVPSTPPLVRRRPAGPQGTRLFNADDLRQLAGLGEPTDDERASVARPVLQACSPGMQRQRFALRDGKQTLGRRGDNDIVVVDLSVSASHAWIINQQGHCVIMNTLSTNGTFVNGKRVHEAILRHGDRVRLGQAEFVFLTRERGEGHGRTALAWTAAVVVLAGAAALAGWWLA